MSNKRVEFRNSKGQLHREDGPAVIIGDHRAWWVNGKRHRIDGPAIIDGDHRAWWVNGKLHREDGPAVIIGDYRAWYVDDVKYTEAEFNEKFSDDTITIQIPANVTKIVIERI